MTELYLHFLNGSLKQQALLLPEGNITCGTGLGCDVQLTLEGQESSFTLCHDGELVRLLSGPQWYRDGVPGEGDGLPVNVVIEVEGCLFLLSPDSAPVVAAALPSLPSSSPVTRLPLLRGWGHHYTGLVAVVVLLIVLVTGLAYWHQRTPALVHAAVAHPWLLEQQQNTLPGLTLQWSSPERVTISGYYPSENVLRPLLQVMRQYGIRYRLLAFNEEDVRDGVHYLAARSGYDDLQITSGQQPGDVDIAGAIIADETWRKFLRELKDIDGLRNWEVKNIAMMNTTDLLNLVKSQALLGQVSIERDKQLYIITGLLTEDQKVALNEGMEKLTRGHQNKIVFQNMVPVSPSDNIFPSPVVSVGGSKDKPFVELQDGRRLQPGARLGNQYEIVAIHSKYGVDLLGDDNLLHYAFTF